MKAATSTKATTPASLAGSDRIGAEVRADRTLLDDLERRRQSARAQQDREFVGRLGREAARDDAAAAKDRLADPRRADHLAIEHDRQQLTDMLAGHGAELARPSRVEMKAHDWLVLLIGRLGVGQTGAADLDPFADHDLALAAMLGARQQLVAGRQTAGQRLIQRGVQIDQMEGQLGGLAEQALDTLRVLLTRHLDQDPVVALALDGRLAGADRIDPPAHDLERLAERRSPGGRGPCCR